MKNQKFIRVKEAKALGLGRIPRIISYNDFLPLNDIWQGYMDELIGDEYLRYVSKWGRILRGTSGVSRFAKKRIEKARFKKDISRLILLVFISHTFFISSDKLIARKKSF